MKRIQFILAILFTLSLSSFAQKNIKIGGGYFGNTLTYPGVVLEFEQETMFTDRASLPFRIDVGFFHHPRYQTGLFVDVNYGFRQYFKSGLFLEESIGLGLLEGILSSDGVYEVDDNGNVTDATRLNKLDLMPSLTLGIGYDLSSSKNKKNLIWMRPKAYWQYPFRTSSAYNFALQVGYTHTIN